MSNIPKHFFQTSCTKEARYLIDLLLKNNEGWDYKHFNNNEMFKYIKENPIDIFPKSADIYKHQMIDPNFKECFFRFYYLYLNGGIFFDSNTMIQENVEKSISKISFFITQNSLLPNTAYCGFMGSESKNVLVLEILKKIYNKASKCLFFQTSITIEDFYSQNKEIYEIIQENKTLLSEMNKNIKIFQEKYINEDQKSIIKGENDETIFIKYLNTSKIIESPYIKKRILKPIENMKIGITFEIPDNTIDIFSSGIRQNVLYLSELLINIGYDVYFIVKDEKISQTNADLKIIFYDKRFKVLKENFVLSIDFDVIITMGYDLNQILFEKIKYMDVKMVKYCCGNCYIIDSEKILYNQHKYRTFVDFVHKDQITYDEIWSIPQMANTNQYYWQTVYRSKCIEVPFIWSDNSIKINEAVNINLNMNYQNRGECKTIAIFEPNMSIMKWCLPAILLCENLYRKTKENINKVFITNILDKQVNNNINDFNLDSLNKLVASFDLLKDNKFSIESRYNTLYFMANHADVVVSHQLENPLNYLYLDLAWMGWPIVHNACLCKDVGYYYDGFNYEMGAEVLNEVLLNHDNNVEFYIEKNRKIIDRYLPTNRELQEKYKKLIDDLFL